MSRHRKHAMCPPRALSLEPMHNAVTQFSENLGWRLFYQDACDTTPSFIKIKRAPTPHCPMDKNLPFKLWRSMLVGKAMRAAMSARNWSLQKGHEHSNRTKLDSLGLRILRAGNRCLVPRDKGGGFVVHLKSDIRRIHTSLLEGSEYNKINTDAIGWTTIFNAHTDLARTICNLFLRQLVKSINIVGACPHASLKITCKDHKISPEHRNLHAAPKNSFASLSLFIKRYFARWLSMRSFFVKDAYQLKCRLANKPALAHVHL
jgi:hypothetical protein